MSGLTHVESCRLVLANDLDVLDGIVDAAEQDVRQLDHLAFRDFALRDDGNFVHAVDSRHAAAPQLGGTEPGQHHEMKRSDAWRALNHNEPVDALKVETGGSGKAGGTKSAVMNPHETLW